MDFAWHARCGIMAHVGPEACGLAAPPLHMYALMEQRGIQTPDSENSLASICWGLMRHA